MAFESLPPFHNPSPKTIPEANADVFAHPTPTRTEREAERSAETETEHWKAEAGCWKKLVGNLVGQRVEKEGLGVDETFAELLRGAQDISQELEIEEQQSEYWMSMVEKLLKDLKPDDVVENMSFLQDPSFRRRQSTR